MNLWLALEVKTHAHHAVAGNWLLNRGDTVCAFCRVTQMGFLRLLSNRMVMQASVKTPMEAWQIYRTMLASPEAAWLAEPEGLDACWENLAEQQSAGGSSWTDAYLAAFAIGHNVRLMTFDRGFRRFEPEGLKLLVLNPPASTSGLGRRGGLSRPMLRTILQAP